MVRIAESRRDEELAHIERVNRYNLALIAFSGSFMSLLVTAGFSFLVVRIAGIFLIASIACSLFALKPRKTAAALVIDDDVKFLEMVAN